MLNFFLRKILLKRYKSLYNIEYKHLCFNIGRISFNDVTISLKNGLTLKVSKLILLFSFEKTFIKKMQINGLEIVKKDGKPNSSNNSETFEKNIHKNYIPIFLKILFNSTPFPVEILNLKISFINIARIEINSKGVGLEGSFFKKNNFTITGLLISKTSYRFDLSVPIGGINMGFDLVSAKQNNTLHIKSVPNNSLKNFPVSCLINISESESLSFNVKYIYLYNIFVLNSKIDINKGTFVCKSKFRLKVRPEIFSFLQKFYNTNIKLLDLKGFASVEILYAISLRQINLQKLNISLIKNDISYNSSTFINKLFNSHANKLGLSFSADGNEFLFKRWAHNTIELRYIPNLMVNLILLLEDPTFNFHKGMDVNRIPIAIVTNIENKRLSMGASTITMQLSRNIFLSHEKSFTRKFDEIILALLLENVYQIAKENILYTYLNIIEFAPSVFGVRDGVNFYFNKSIEEVSIEEIILLTYIIPRPIHFYNAILDDSTQVKINVIKYFKYILDLLIDKSVINEIDYKFIKTKLHIYINNRSYVLKIIE